MSEEKKRPDPAELLSGTLNILGLKLDLGELLGSPERLQGRLEELRGKLKAAGGKEALSDEEWQSGGISISGHLRTRGVLGDREFHVGSTRPVAEAHRQEPEEATEPPVDVFDEGEQVTIVADVPGASLEDLELTAQGRSFSLATKAMARRRYEKKLDLGADLDPQSLKATCRNGVLEVKIHKLGKGQAQIPPGKGGRRRKSGGNAA